MIQCAVKGGKEENTAEDSSQPWPGSRDRCGRVSIINMVVVVVVFVVVVSLEIGVGV